MLEELFGFIKLLFKYLWRKPEWRPVVTNFGLTIILSVVVFFYVNYKHSEALAAIRSQSSTSADIVAKLEKINDRIDAVYRVVMLLKGR